LRKKGERPSRGTPGGGGRMNERTRSMKKGGASGGGGKVTESKNSRGRKESEELVSLGK